MFPGRLSTMCLSKVKGKIRDYIRFFLEISISKTQPDHNKDGQNKKNKEENTFRG